MNNLLAQVDYTPLVKIPQLIDAGGKMTPKSFFEGVIPLIIGVAGGLAVIMIVVGGIKYMTTDAFMGKKEAKDTIRNAFLGLLLAISSYVLLNTINPDLVKINLSIERLDDAGALTGPASESSLTAEQTGCINNCVPFREVDRGVPIKNSNACSNNPCYINEGLYEKLVDMTEELEGKIGWQVTEAFPPTVDHSSNCHNPRNSLSGKCVDAALTARTTPANVKIFLDAIDKYFESFQYEVCDTAKYNTYKNSPELSAHRNKIVPCPTNANAEHAHINL